MKRENAVELTQRATEEHSDSKFANFFVNFNSGGCGRSVYYRFLQLDHINPKADGDLMTSLIESCYAPHAIT